MHAKIVEFITRHPLTFLMLMLPFVMCSLHIVMGRAWIFDAPATHWMLGVWAIFTSISYALSKLAEEEAQTITRR